MGWLEGDTDGLAVGTALGESDGCCVGEMVGLLCWTNSSTGLADGDADVVAGQTFNAMDKYCRVEVARGKMSYPCGQGKWTPLVYSLMIICDESSVSSILREYVETSSAKSATSAFWQLPSFSGSKCFPASFPAQRPE